MEKILVLFPGALGDFLCFLPALRRLARDGKVDLLARSEYADLIEPAVAVGSLERPEVSRLFVPGAESDFRLRNFFAGYAFVYSWMGSGESVFVANLEAVCDKRSKCFPFRPSARMHIADYYLSCVGETAPGEIFPRVHLREEAVNWSRRFWRKNGLKGKEVLAVSPGSGAKEKNWPAGFFKEAAQAWERRHQRKALIILGPVEEDRGECGCDWGRAAVARGLDLAKLSALLSRSNLYLGNDSGVTHLAAALGVESVALFGPTDPDQWAPRGGHAAALRLGIDCSPCSLPASKACAHRSCLATLAPGAVVEILEKLSSKRRIGSETASLTRIGADITVNFARRSTRRAELFQ